MSLLTEMMKVIVSYIIVMLLMHLGNAFLFRGLFTSMWSVKTSAGKKLLVNVRGVRRNYFRSGKIFDGALHFKDENKEKKIITFPTDNKEYVYRFGTMDCINWDEKTNNLITPDMEGVSSFDASKYDSLYERCLYRPQVFDGKEKIILITLVFIGLIVIVEGFLLYKMYALISSMAVV